jgi:hypothetical protein
VVAVHERDGTGAVARHTARPVGKEAPVTRCLSP